jgi:anti-sigma B factor antagonist
MTVTERTMNGVTILDITGRMTVEVPPEVRVSEMVRRLASEGNKRVLINLAAVPHIDSTGLADLVASYTTLVRQGGMMTLEHVTPYVAKLLEITRLDAIFGVFSSEADAVASLASRTVGSHSH